MDAKSLAAVMCGFTFKTDCLSTSSIYCRTEGKITKQERKRIRAIAIRCEEITSLLRLYQLKCGTLDPGVLSDGFMDRQRRLLKEMTRLRREATRITTEPLVSSIQAAANYEFVTHFDDDSGFITESESESEAESNSKPEAESNSKPDDEC